MGWGLLTLKFWNVETEAHSQWEIPVVAAFGRGRGRGDKRGLHWLANSMRGKVKDGTTLNASMYK